MPDANVFLACPGPHPVSWEVVQALLCPASQAAIFLQTRVSSVLPFGFNQLWAQALNMRKSHGFTHFAMLHSDVAPGQYWLDTLLAEQHRVGADVLSCVVPLKDERGVTSTAVLHKDEGRVQRLTVREVHTTLPGTFRQADLRNDTVLLVNTGCWVCDFTQPWVEQITWQFQNSLVRLEDGTFEARTLAEDWHFSLQCFALGVSVAATRLVPLAHMDGQTAYRNDHIWGTWQTDEGGR